MNASAGRSGLLTFQSRKFSKVGFTREFFPLDRTTDDLVCTAGSIAVRGLDESLASQPRDMYWNPTGMMNSCWFRIAIHTSLDSNNDTLLTFEHPTMPGLQPGGWMQRMKDAGLDPLKPVFTKSVKSDSDIDTVLERSIAKKPRVVMTKPGVSRMITMEEVRAQGATEEDPWFIVHGEVYDGKGFLKDHP